MAQLSAVDSAYAGLEPVELWRHFSALNRIPRPSGSEDRAAQYVREIAEGAGASWETDAAGNLVVDVAATEGRGDAAVVAVQAHLDMVCDTDADVVHDWESDPIVPRRDGDDIMATGTTLGADDGIGVAAALALLTTSSLTHGPLELIFTVQEETGLRGALAFDGSLLDARLLLNLDGEDSACLEIGSSGTDDIAIELPVTPTEISTPGARAFDVVIAGLRGGHSGTDIGTPHANALKLVVELVEALAAASLDLRLTSLDGGIARNAIPRSAEATLVVSGRSAADVSSAVAAAVDDLTDRWRDVEPGMTVSSLEAPLPRSVLTQDSADAVLAFLARAPHGVLASADPPEGTGRTSANLALAAIAGNEARLLQTSRSHVAASQQGVFRRIAELAAELGGHAEITSGYPPWSSDPDGGLLALAVDAYTAINGRPPALEAVDGGLECGVIAAKVPGMQAVSFGPRISGAHTPRERLDSSTVPAFWKLLVTLLEALSDEPGAPIH